MCQAAALALLAVVLAANVYRAATQSFTTDEAYTANLYLHAPFRDVLTLYDANNHVLNTLLLRLSAAALGVSELTLRLPSLLGGAAYLIAALLLAQRLLGRGPLFLLAFAALALNPFVLDHLSAARGYGTGLGLYLWAVYLLDRYAEAPDRRWLVACAVALALSVAANLVFVFPGAALVAAATPLVLRHGGVPGLVDQLALPGIAVAFVLLVIPLAHARPGNFYFGAASLAGTLDGLVVASFYHSTPDQSDGGVAFPALRRALRLAAPGVAAAVCLVSAVAAARMGWRLARGGGPPVAAPGRLLLLAGGSLTGAALLAEAVHRLWDVPLPFMRTAIYFLPLFTLASFALAASTPGRRPRVAALALAALFFGLCTAQYALQWNTRYYLEWPHEARMKTAMRRLAAEARRNGAPLRVGATVYLEPSVNFYARLYGIPMNRVGLEGPVPGLDYYLLAGEDRALAGRLGLRPLFEDGFGELLLAARLR